MLILLVLLLLLVPWAGAASDRATGRGAGRLPIVLGGFVLAAAGNVRHAELVSMLTERLDGASAGTRGPGSAGRGGRSRRSRLRRMTAPAPGITEDAIA